MDKRNLDNKKDNINDDKTHNENDKSKRNNLNKRKKINNKMVGEKIDDDLYKETQSSDINQSSLDINNNSGINKIIKQKKIIKIAIILIITFLVLVAIALIILFVKKPWKKKENKYKPINQIFTESDNTSNNDSDIESIFSINQQIKRIKIKIKSNYNILVEGINKTISLNKTYYFDISVYKNYTEGIENNIHYNKKYTYSIVLFKKCLNNNECENEIDSLIYLENIEGEPSLCLFNITNNNIILSIKCPIYFTESQKSEIISNLILNNLVDFLNIKEKININLENKTDSCGYNCLYETYIINNNDNSTYVVYWKNRTISNKVGYRKKKELYINYSVIYKNETFYNDAIKKINFGNIEKINITEKVENSNNEDDEDNYNETTLFNDDKLDFKISLKNKIEKKDGNLNAYLILKINDLEKNINYLSKSIELNEIQEYKTEINTIQNLRREFIQNFKNNSEIIVEDILDNFNDINEEIYIGNIKDILYSIKENKSNSQNFKSEIILSNNKLGNIYNGIYEYINPFEEKINMRIKNYTEELIELKNQTYEKLEDLKDALNSQINIETKIANYYLNNTSTSCFEIIQEVKNIFENYYKNANNSINNEIDEMIKKLNANEIQSRINDIYSKFNNYFLLNDLENENIKSNINNSINNITNIIRNLQDEIKKKKNNKKIGFNISDSEIINSKNKFNEILNHLLNTCSNIDNLDINDVDKTYDRIMNDFKDNMTKLLIFLEDEKNNKFPLSEDILNDNFFSSEEKKNIKNNIFELSNNIINEIKENYNIYLNNIQKEIEKLLSNKSELNSFIFEINVLCSNDSLLELVQSFEKAFKIYLNKTKNNLKLVLKNYEEYLNDDKKILEKLNIHDEYQKISSIKITKKFEKIRVFKQYIENNLINDLSEEFIDILNNIQLILFKIRNNQLNNYYDKIDDLLFINENIDKIKNISYERFKLYFSNEVFKNYQNEINNIISEISNDLNNMLTIINSLDRVNECNDKDLYIQLNSEDFVCINIFDELNGEVEFKTIYDDNEFNRFLKKYNIFKSSLNEAIAAYNSKIENFFSSLYKVEEPEINLDLYPIENKINSLLSEKFEDQLINIVYDYFNSSIDEKIQNIMDEFLNRLNDTFDFLKEEISENQNIFKNSFNEFSYMATIYENIITQNITRNYFDYIIDSQKNNFNYTISYYYNWFINLINSTHKNIINNLPLDKNGININIQQYKQTINNKFYELINKITNSKKDSLSIEKQIYTLSVPRTNFFKANSILSNNVLKARNLLQIKEREIGGIDNGKYNTHNSLLAKFYSENSNFAKQIKDIHNISYGNINSNIFNQEKFKELIVNNFEFDNNEFINELNLLLSNLNLENHINLLKLKKNFENMFDKEISLYFSNENKDGISDKINNLYNKFMLNESQIKEINENVNQILNRIIQNIQNEKDRIENETISNNNNYSKVEEKLKEYRNEIINNIEKNISEIVNGYKEIMIDKVYRNKVEIDLSNYLKNVTEFTKDYEEEKLLNCSYNLGTIINNINEDLINKYNESLIKQINYKNQIKLIDVFNIEEINQIIYKKIDNIYNNSLLPILIKFSNNSENQSYDFDSTINNDIKYTIESKLENIKNILISLKDFYEININDWPTLDFIKIKEKFETKYKKDFEYFLSLSKENESANLKKFLNNVIKSKFALSLNNTFYSFGNEFLDRYMKYNEIFKIKQYNSNYLYYLTQTLLYNQILYSFKSNSHILPKNLIDTIHNLSNIDKIIENKNIEIIKEVNKQINNITEILKEDIIKKYITDIKNETSINSQFTEDLITKISSYFNNTKIYDFEEDYYKIFNYSLNEHINKEYLKSMNENKNYTINIIKAQKEDLKIKIPDNNEDDNEELNNINIIRNNVIKNIEKYYNYSFKISDELSNEINKNYNDKLYDAIEELIEIINNEEENLKNKVNQSVNNFSQNLNIDNFIETSNNIFSNTYGKINNIINNLENNNKKNNRNLNENLNKNDDEILLNQDSMQKILRISKKNKIFINRYEFNKKLIEIIKNFNFTLKESRKSIENDYQGEIKDYILSKLINLEEQFLDYYKKINHTLYNITKGLNTSIYQINDLLIDKYKNENNSIYGKINLIKEKLQENNNKQHTYNQINTMEKLYLEDFIINYRIKDNNNENSFNLNVNDETIYEPIIRASLKNKIQPNMEIEIINNSGNYKILLSLNILNNDDNIYLKYNIELQTFDNDSDGNSSGDNTCINCKRQYNFKYNDNLYLNLM